jgi:hypothetical protein
MRENMRGIWRRMSPPSKAVTIVWATLVLLLILFPPVRRPGFFLNLVLGRYMEPIWSRFGRRNLDISVSRVIAEGVAISVVGVALIAVFQVLGRPPDDRTPS